MRRVLASIFVLSVMSSAVAAHAATANFQGNCTENPGVSVTCVFDALKPTSNPSSCTNGSPQFYWDLGDGTYSGWNTSSSVSHTYAWASWYELKLWVYCLNDSPSYADPKTRDLCITIGGAGCIAVNGTYN